MEPQLQNGADLEEIQTEAIGFQAAAGESKLSLLPSPWPSDHLPPPTASLLSIASNKSLLAAAGPESVVVASTDSVRQALSASTNDNPKSFTPQLILPLGMRVSQVAFSADENFLVLSAENGGGLAVYDVQAIMQGNTQTAFEIATNGTALRALVPNPTLEQAGLFATVSTNGELMMADLRTRQIFAGPQGPILKTGVSCVSWSNRGKQLVAGLGDGSLSQMTPKGNNTGHVSKPSIVEGDQYVSSVSWLENNVFLVAHTPSSFDPAGMAPETTYHLITRLPKENPPSITYQKLPEPIAPFGLNRSPSSQFLHRLRNFPPNLDDTIIVASSTSGDIGLVTRSKVPLSDDAPAERISNIYTTTMMADDSRRAQLPLPTNDDFADTTPIGLGIDLSSKDKVEKPLPREEYTTSPGPLPALLVLNNEGILSIWWFVYAESIRQGTTFPGLVAAGGSAQQQTGAQSSNLTNNSPQAPAPFGQNNFGSRLTSSPFDSSPSPTSLNNQSPAFGAPSTLGGKSMPFGAGPLDSAGQQKQGPVFGQSSFGMAGGMGNRNSPWGAAPGGSAAASGSVFGQSGFNAAKPAPFGTPTPSSTQGLTSGAFTSFASKTSPFMTAAPTSGAENAFSKPSTTSSFGSGMDTDNTIGTPAKNDSDSNHPFGSGAFTLGSTFKKDVSSSNDAPKSNEVSEGSMFGSGFGDALGEAQKEPATPHTKDTDMDGDNDAAPDDTQRTVAEDASTTPADTPAAPKSSFPQQIVPPKADDLFGTQAQSQTSPAAVGNSQPTGFSIGSFGKPTNPSPLTKVIPEDAGYSSQSIPSSPKIKEEPPSDENSTSPLNKADNASSLASSTPKGSRESQPSEAPLPPESTSKTSFAPGDSSNSSKSSDDAPLPPDFLPAKTKLQQVEPSPPQETALPSEDEDDGSEELSDHASYADEEGTDAGSGNLDEEGSGIDVAQEISPTTDLNQSPKMTPGSSFGGPQEKSPQGGLFGRITAPENAQKEKPPLFGEVGKAPPAPYLPPPTKTQESPRSPSPIRSSRLGDSLRPDNARSISAPAPFQALNNRKAALSRMAVPSKPSRSPGEIRKQVREQMTPQQSRTRQDDNPNEEQDLSDREDERVREELATDVEGTLVLDPFLAHQDYVGGDEKPGIPGQIEKVYRDINSMIDTLGINARSLKAFIKGHEEMHKVDGARDRDDLEKDDWCLIEIGDLPSIEDDLIAKLEDSCTVNTQGDIAQCRGIRKELTLLRAKGADVVRAVDTHTHPDELESARTAPLSLDQLTQQHDLRKKMAKFQKALAEAEANITMLRTKLTSCDSSNSNGPPLKKPTVEAVTNTISKMTNIVEKKNRDLDALEIQMQQLRLGSPANFRSRESSPFVSPSPRRRPVSKPGASVNGYHHTPNRSSKLGRSVNGDGTPLRESIEVTSEKVQEYREKTQRRREVNEIIRREFEKDGLRIRPL
ncbi:hypothetical protein ACLMJK_007964 [Lecanora helva]